MNRRILHTVPQLAGAAATCAVGFLALLIVAYVSDRAGRADALALEQFGARLGRPQLAWAASHVARLGDPAPFALLAAGVCALALFVRGVRQALGVGALLLGANLTTQLFKPVLAEPRATLDGWVVGPAFPSGHATASMTLALAAVLASPGAFRPLTAVAGAVFAISVGFAVAALGHFPSDVAAGYLVAGGWCFAVLAALKSAGDHSPGAETEEAERHRWTGKALLALVALCAAFGASRLPDLVEYARAHTVFTLVAAATATLAVALVALAAVASASLPARRPRSTPQRARRWRSGRGASA